jgi:hypothetical protein
MLLTISHYSGYRCVTSMAENKVECRLTMVIHLRPIVEVGSIQKLFVWEIVFQKIEVKLSKYRRLKFDSSLIRVMQRCNESCCMLTLTMHLLHMLQ